MSNLIKTSIQLLAALEAVTVEGWLALDWKWVVDPIATGWIIRVSFNRPDRDTGEPVRGYGRGLFLAYECSARDVAGAAFVAIKLIVDHELLEAFHVNGHRIFDPHAPIPE